MREDRKNMLKKNIKMREDRKTHLTQIIKMREDRKNMLKNHQNERRAEKTSSRISEKNIF